MKIFRKVLPLAAAASMLFAAGAAQADVLTTFNIKDGLGTTLASNVNRLDWSSNGSGLAVGLGPFGTPLHVGQNFEFLYQATMVGKNGGTNTPDLGGRLDGESNGVPTGDFEITIAAKMALTVTSTIGTTATFGLNPVPGASKVAIYFDTARNANTPTGAGFDDGIMVALLTIDTTSAVFNVFSPNNGQGSAKLHAGQSEAGDFVDANYFEGVMSLIFGVNFESSLNYPAGTAATAGFHLNGSSNNGDPFASVTPVISGNPGSDLMFKVDGDSGFTRNVPEPGTALLLGLGLLGLAHLRRRA